MRTLCRSAALAFVCLVGATWFAAPAAARHNLSILRLGADEVRPGGVLSVSGYSYTQPVSIRFNALDGPVLATLTPDSNNDIKGEVTIPAETKPGSYVLFAVQGPPEKPTRLPARARISVAGDGGGPVLGAPTGTIEARSDDLLGVQRPSTGSLVLIGLGAAGVALFLAGGALLLGASRRTGTAAVGARR